MIVRFKIYQLRNQLNTKKKYHLTGLTRTYVGKKQTWLFPLKEKTKPRVTVKKN
jgi:hypothetical protein